MFGLIKWFFIFLILGTFLYVANFFWKMDQDAVDKVKKDAISAIDKGEHQPLTGPLAQQLKEDLKIKQETLTEKIKKKIKESLHRLID